MKIFVRVAETGGFAEAARQLHLSPPAVTRAISALEDEIAFQGAGTIAAFIMEPILGAGGVIVPHASFMPGVEAICRRNEQELNAVGDKQGGGEEAPAEAAAETAETA